MTFWVVFPIYPRSSLAASKSEATSRLFAPSITKEPILWVVSRALLIAESRSWGVPKSISEDSGEAQLPPNAPTEWPVEIESRLAYSASLEEAWRVGVNIIAPGLPVPGSMFSSNGAIYAIRVPDPGPASIRRLLFLAISGMTFRCSSNGAINPSAVSASAKVGDSPKS